MTSKCMALKICAKIFSLSYANTAITPLQQLHHYSSYATAAVTPLQQLRHYSSYATTAVTPLRSWQPGIERD